MQLTKFAVIAVLCTCSVSALPNDLGNGKPASGHPINAPMPENWNHDQEPQSGEWRGLKAEGLGSHESSGKISDHQPRDLIARADTDFHVKECSTMTAPQKCQTRVVVPKGKNVGDCLDSLIDFDDKYIYLLETQLMCTYYMNRGCTGMSGGPWSSKETEYSFYNWHHKHFPFTNPLSYRCELQTFSKGPAPAPGCGLLGCG